MQKLNVLFFVPFARILPHSSTEYALAQTLISEGHQVTMITCGEALKGQCITLSALSVSSVDNAKIDQTCLDCVKCSKLLFKDSIPLKYLLGRTKDHNIGQKIDSLIQNVTANNFSDFSFENIPFGKIAAYQHMIELKKFSPDIAEHELPIFKKELNNCLLTYFAVTNFLDKNHKFDVGFVYNSLYSVNSIFKHLFELQDGKIYSLHSGPNIYYGFDRVALMNKNTFTYLKKLRSEWPKHQNKPLAPQRLNFVIKHFQELMAAKSVFVYSEPLKNKNATNIRQKFSIYPHRKICLVALSSYDERFAAEFSGNLEKPNDLVFETQAQWIKSIVTHARSRDDLHFIIRLHPREFPNKRESVLSKHAQLIHDELINLPTNVSINEPNDKLSIYDFVGCIDVGLTAWSNVAKELMTFGIPVVVYSAESQWFPPDFVHVATSREHYFSLIDSATLKGRSIDYSVNMFRWMAFEGLDNTISLNSNYSSALSNRLKSIIWRIINKIFGKISFLSFRVSSVIESEIFIKAINSGNLPVDFRPNPNLNNIYNDRNQAKSGVSKLSKIIYGHKSNWPIAILKLTQQS